MRWLSIVVFLMVCLTSVVWAADTNQKVEAAKDIEMPAAAFQSRRLRVGVHARSIGTFDPHRAASSQDRTVVDMMYNGLMRYRPGNASVLEPDLAESVPGFIMDGQRQVWTVALRKGVMFHPGLHTEAYELTADDVVFSLNRSADPRYSSYAGSYKGMSFKKIGRYAVEIVLDSFMSPTLFLPRIANYSGGFIVSKQAIESCGNEEFSKHPVGTGPFRFQDYVRENKATFKAHDGYFRGRPKLDGVEIHLLPGLQEREKGLIEKRLDVIVGGPSQEWIDSMRRSDGILVDFFGVKEELSLYMNSDRPPLDDIRVRKAIAYAIDRQAFLEIAVRDLIGLSFSPLPDESYEGALTEAEVKVLGLDYGFDPEISRSLLEKAGYPDGFTLDLVSSEKRLYLDTYQVIKEQLAAVGIEVNLTVVSHSRMHRLIRSQSYPLVLYSAWRPDADAFLTRFFHSDSIVVTGEKPDTNFSHYGGIDRMVEAARMEIDTKRQAWLWNQAQIKILSDMAALPIYYTLHEYVRHSHVDYGHELKSTVALYPQFTEKTRIIDPVLPAKAP